MPAVSPSAPDEEEPPGRAFADSGTRRIRFFRRNFYPDVTDAQWDDWRWQLRNRLRSAAQFDRFVVLSDSERAALAAERSPLPVSVTPYYAALIDPLDPNDPIRRTVLPVIEENSVVPEESPDPLAEHADSPLPGIVHRYPDRVLFLATDRCATYCRYCTRSRLVGRSRATTDAQLSSAIEYVRAHPEVRDVVVSGGDPLMLPTEKLASILARLRAVPHVEIIRIGTKIPAVLPMRITPRLVGTLRRFHPVWISLHFTHPREMTARAVRACEMLADGGFPLGSQTVLLRGVNDRPETLTALFHALVAARVRPYYLYQCDPVAGSSRFRTTIDTGIAIIEKLRGFTSGYAVPTYVVDAPGGGGKIVVSPQTHLGSGEGCTLLKNYEGAVYAYPDVETPAVATV